MNTEHLPSVLKTTGQTPSLRRDSSGPLSSPYIELRLNQAHLVPGDDLRQIDLPCLDGLNSSKSQGRDFAFQTALKGRNNAAPYKGRDSAGRRAGYGKGKAQNPEAMSFEKAMIKHDGV